MRGRKEWKRRGLNRERGTTIYSKLLTRGIAEIMRSAVHVMVTWKTETAPGNAD